MIVLDRSTDRPSRAAIRAPGGYGDRSMGYEVRRYSNGLQLHVAHVAAHRSMGLKYGVYAPGMDVSGCAKFIGGSDRIKGVQARIDQFAACMSWRQSDWPDTEARPKDGEPVRPYGAVLVGWDGQTSLRFLEGHLAGEHWSGTAYGADLQWNGEDFELLRCWRWRSHTAQSHHDNPRTECDPHPLIADIKRSTLFRVGFVLAGSAA